MTKRNPQHTREKLLHSAFEEILQHGFQGMRVDEVLLKAELKKGAFYHHFRSKTELGYCVVDEPKLPKLMPFIPRATSDLGYFRLHGRNPNWFNVPTSVRYDYRYSEEELKSFIQPIREIEGQTAETLIFFNNCHGGSAARNALELLRMFS